MTIEIDSHIKLELIDNRHSRELFELVTANKEHLREWLPWVDHMQDAVFIQSFIKGSLQRHHKKTEYAFVILYDNVIAGRIGLYKIDHQNRTGEIGYWIAENYQGKGIVSRAVKALVSFCFNHLAINRIEIRCGTGNHRSQTIPERLNFRLEGVLRQAEWMNNRFIDLNLYSMVKADWDN